MNRLPDFPRAYPLEDPPAPVGPPQHEGPPPTREDLDAAPAGPDVGEGEGLRPIPLLDDVTPVGPHLDGDGQGRAREGLRGAGELVPGQDVGPGRAAGRVDLDGGRKPPLGRERLDLMARLTNWGRRIVNRSAMPARWRAWASFAVSLIARESPNGTWSRNSRSR